MGRGEGVMEKVYEVKYINSSRSFASVIVSAQTKKGAVKKAISAAKEAGYPLIKVTECIYRPDFMTFTQEELEKLPF